MAEETWLRPYAVDDPSDEWRNEEDTLLGGMTKQATRDDLPPSTWTGYLIWTFRPVTCDAIDIGFYSIANNWEYELYRNDGQDWHVVAAELDPYGTLPKQFFIPPVRTEKIRLRLRHFDVGLKDMLAFRVMVRSVCLGPLAPICAIFHTIGDWFTVLAEAIVDVMFVGDSLSAPFYELAETWHEMGDTCCTAGAALQEILDLLEGGITWEEIETFVRGLLPDLPVWFDDAASWLATMLMNYFHTLYAIWLDPEAWIEENVLSLLPALPDWLSDPVAWLAEMLEVNFPLLYYLIVDPVGEVLYLVGLAFDLTPYEAQSGEFIVKALFERWFPELYLLWRDPERWIEDNVFSAIEKLWETLWEALDALGGQLGEFLSLTLFPVGWICNNLLSWVDTVQERGDQLMSLEFMVDLEASQAGVEEMLPQIEETWKEIETEMFQEDEVYLPLIEKVWE